MSALQTKVIEKVLQTLISNGTLTGANLLSVLIQGELNQEKLEDILNRFIDLEK
jgi:hypothetical protein